MPKQEILFRGFHPCEDGDTTIYVEGKAVKGRGVQGFYSCITDNYTPKNIHHIQTYEKLKNGEIIWKEFLNVLPSTVGQYTGLEDKNGRKIFKGDIVKGNVFGDYWIGEIVWIDCIAGFGVRYFHRDDPTAWENSSMLKMLTRYKMDEFAAEIVGTIFDNPELMEELK